MLATEPVPAELLPAEPDAAVAPDNKPEEEGDATDPPLLPSVDPDPDPDPGRAAAETVDGAETSAGLAQPASAGKSKAVKPSAAATSEARRPALDT
jgi:hypothetical protein